MTREEAIEYWEGLRKTFSGQLEKEENHFGRMHLQTTIDALDMAISALRQQETVAKCNDLYDEDGGDIYQENDSICSSTNLPCCRCNPGPCDHRQETVTNRNGLNDPLTLDELRQMDGEPVWIKLFDPDEEFWVLRNEWVDTRNPEPVILFHMRWYSHADYGKTWLAYRQKPEEGPV